jgi:hypothetical protein
MGHLVRVSSVLEYTELANAGLASPRSSLASTKLLKDKDTLRLELGNNYGASVVPFLNSAPRECDGAVLASHPEFVHPRQSGSTRTYFHYVRLPLGRLRYFLADPFRRIGLCLAKRSSKYPS